MEMLALQRYRTLLGYRAWRDDLPPHLSAPLPAYGDVLHGQRLHLLSLRQLAGQGEVAEVRAGLSADFEFWRGAQLNAETLIAKMIAVAALRNHFFFSNLVLRRLPADQVMRRDATRLATSILRRRTLDAARHGWRAHGTRRAC